MTLQFLEHRIPPPLVLLACLLMVWVTKLMLDDLALPADGLKLWSIPYALMGMAVMILAAMRFMRFKTTVNPLEPSAASYLVQDGVFE